MKLVVNNPDPGPRKPPEAVTTPHVALIASLKRASEWRRVAVIAEDADGLIEVRWSSMTEAQGVEMLACGARLLGVGLRGEA